MSIIAAGAIDQSLQSTWHQIQDENATLSHPFLGPEFVKAVATVRDDVEIAVLEQDGDIVGFFAFQRGKSNAGEPVGGALSNIHGAVLRPDVAIDGRELIQRCRLNSWTFHQAIAQQKLVERYQHLVKENCIIDLRAGFDAYETARKEASTSYKSMLRKLRKLKREAEVRFEFHSDDPAMLDQLIAWKRAQWQARGTLDTFAVEWTGNLLRHILANPSARLTAVLSVLHIDGEPAAINYDAIGGDVADIWIPSYGEQHGKHSPGVVLLRSRLEAYAERGIRKVYLGNPDLAWKTTFRSGSETVATGSIERSPVAQAVKHGQRTAITWVRNSPLRAPARAATRALRRLSTGGRLQPPGIHR